MRVFTVIRCGLKAASVKLTMTLLHEATETVISNTLADTHKSTDS